MAGEIKRKRGRPKKSEQKEECKECDTNITDATKGMGCEICKTYICLNCTGISEDVYNYLVENDVEIPFICKPCKEEIPKVRELMGLKTKHNELVEEVSQLKTELATQDLKIANYVDNLKTMNDRLQALEARPVHNPADFPTLLDANRPQQLQQFIQDHMRPALQTEITEYDKIQAIKLNLVCSGMKESNLTDNEADVEDRMSFINLIKDEFNIIPDIEKVERCGRKKLHIPGNPAPQPRFLKIFMKDQRTRKLILSKAVTLRNSETAYVSQNVYIRPDQTSKQLEE